MDPRTPLSLRRRPLAVLPVLAVTLAAAAGCGGSDDAAFVDGYNDAVAPLSTLMTDLGPAASADPAAAGQSLVELADGLDRVHADLAALQPPEDAADELDALLASLDEGTGQVRAMAGAAESGDVAKLTKATARFSRTGTDLVSAEEELRAAVEG